MVIEDPNTFRRFWAKVEVDGECWVWRGLVVRRYGTFFIGPGNARPMMRAHRFAWAISHGYSIPEGLHVCHSCDRPLCVRPDHLFVGTNRENMIDCSKKDRLRKGELNHNAKLTKAKVVEIRTLAKSGVSQRDIAVQYSVSGHTIWAIIKRRTWRHVV